MFARLSGIVADMTADGLILDVNNVGYLVVCSAKTLERLPMGSPAVLKVETQVREESITLFGFLDAEEQRWFRLLQTVQGVGAKAAMAVLSALRPGALALAVAELNHKEVARAHGIGPKIAMRIVNELKDKALVSQSISQEHPAGVSVPQATSSAQEEAASALMNLGFKPLDAARAVAVAARAGEEEVSALVRQALKSLARE